MMNLKRTTTIALTVLVAAMLAAPMTASAAVTFTLNSYDIDYYNNDPDQGLVIDVKKILEEPYSFDLNGVGSTHTVNRLFKIWTTETAVNGDDQKPKDITVSFSFTAPPPPFGDDSTGHTVGGKSGLFGSNQWGEVSWDGPAVLNFGPLGDGILKITLSDEVFNEGIWWGLHDGKEYGAYVSATFELCQEATAIPEPLSVLVWSVLGLFGVVITAMRRRRK